MFAGRSCNASNAELVICIFGKLIEEEMNLTEGNLARSAVVLIREADLSTPTAAVVTPRNHQIAA